MFELYTEKARRVIFFARYEASRIGSPYIDTEHLLIGLEREDPEALQRLLGKALTGDTFRGLIAKDLLERDAISTSVDLPLSNEGKRVLAYAAEEASRLGHRHIGVEHLLLGLMREKGSVAERLLKSMGADLATMRTRAAAEEKPEVSYRPRGYVKGEVRGPGETGPARGSGSGFERYSEKARRVIFFARYETSLFGQGTIEPEHLLLGMLRECLPILYELLGLEVPWAEMRTRIEEKLGPANPRISTSVDLPLSESAKQVLGLAEEECDQLGGGTLEIGHLLLGLVREESFAAQLLRERGADPEKIREKLRSPE